MPAPIILEKGQRFGRWTVNHEEPHKNRRRIVNCTCSCGTTRSVALGSLAGGVSRSCGCLSVTLWKTRLTKHGDSGTQLYGAWKNMRIRCMPGKQGSKHYHDRGIRVCSEWQSSYETFREWALTNGFEPEKKMTLDRKRNDENYSPDNCRWISQAAQLRNTRRSLRWTVLGVTYDSAGLAGAALGVSEDTVHWRCNSPNFPDWAKQGLYE